MHTAFLIARRCSAACVRPTVVRGNGYTLSPANSIFPIALTGLLIIVAVLAPGTTLRCAVVVG